ncbi:hypothetical protein EW146_g2177 [Bondarzewia mesenterica]|uniref:2-amino-4-hydroxy-6-hydroxymethyldihydropteridine diphosphokinase n=1 Tax=Bondarzewia mesenterica TaxID=1095465 RepID=A0A4S4M1N3_9AGAM|nr:hypothetical protein EW146_g2177 [Bondarzewia mesenterica]
MLMHLEQKVEESSFISVEALASLVAQNTLLHTGQERDVVRVRAAKPKALVFAEAAEVEIVRTLRDYQSEAGQDNSTNVLSIPNASASTGPLLSKQQDVPVMRAPALVDLLSGIATEPLPKHTAAIALGSNLGDRFANIELALRLLEDTTRFPQDGSPMHKVSVVDTSFMYESAPMYVTDQPNFINCACIVKTNMSPLHLLRHLKVIEAAVGRVPTIRNGPRAIDLDILTYDDVVFDSRIESERATFNNLQSQLVIPHPRIAEREFVLRPLDDMVPNYVHPVYKKSIRELLAKVTAAQPPDTLAMNKVMPFPHYPHAPSPESSSENVLPSVPPTATYWAFSPLTTPPNQVSAPRKTRIMATLNATPDSFSDGSTHNTLDTALEYTKSSVAAGAEIIDIGGYSTRPGAAYVSPEEETHRIVPIIEQIRNLSEPATSGVLISVDTFRHDVARAAVLAGANCINDVYAFTGPTYPLDKEAAAHLLQMRRAARELAVPVVLMHSRGDAGSNKDYSAYGYANTGNKRDFAVLEGVALELGEKVEAIQEPRFCPVDGEQNVLREYPQLVGASRKSFLEAVLACKDEEGTYAGRSVPPMGRGWATAAAVACAVQQGAAVIRVHDALEQGDVTRISNALWG